MDINNKIHIQNFRETKWEKSLTHVPITEAS